MHEPTRWSEQLIRQSMALLSMAGPDLSHARVLDFGCQNGDLVAHLREQGIDAWGFDIGEASDDGPIRRRPVEDYHLPWPDDHFDVVVSHHVWEHVTNREVAARELHRVMKTGAVGMHAFPARLRLFEAHFRTPFGGVLPYRSWIWLWSFRRKPGRDQMTSGEYAREGARFIRELWYPTWSEIEDVFRDFRLESVAGRFAEGVTGRSPLPDRLVSTFHLRVIRTVKEGGAVTPPPSP